MQSSHIYRAYAPRIDKVTVTAEGKYRSIKGTPSFDPRPPIVSRARTEDELALFSLMIPPYTTEPKQIDIIENKAYRHTMKDISRIAQRVENLEYYVSLNALEKKTSDMAITDQNGLDRFKNGILVDNFTGVGVTDYWGEHSLDIRDLTTNRTEY